MNIGADVKMANQKYGEAWKSIKDAYDLLEDKQSKQLFWARMMADMDDESNCLKIFYQNSGKLQNTIRNELKWTEQLASERCPVYIYGAKRLGKLIYTYLTEADIQIQAFVDRDYAAAESCCGIPVLSLEQFCRECSLENGYVFIASVRAYQSILDDLKKCHFPQSRILPALFQCNNVEEQYFEFMEHMPPDGAFIDGGCYDCATSIAFAKRVYSKYSKIIAFEPDQRNYRTCLNTFHIHPELTAELIFAGLSSDTQILPFQINSQCPSSSKFDQNGKSYVKTVALDEVVGMQRVSFIKLDIEGFELNALIGARKTIQRDKPLCAICVYHNRGDMLSIMKYLSEIVPEYHFALRHYTANMTETVLYAFI